MLHPKVEVQITERGAREIIRDLRDGRLDVAFVVGAPSAEDCNSRPLWTENLLIALPESHPLAAAEGVRWSELADSTFLVRGRGSGPQVNDHIVIRMAAHWRHPQIERFDVGRDTLMSLVAQGYGVTLTSEPATRGSVSGVAFRPILDEPEPITFSAVWSPHNRNQALLNLLTLAQQKADKAKLAGIR